MAPGPAQPLDHEAEGLLDGIDDEGGRARRIALIDYLVAEGATLDEIRQAQRDGRLQLLPVERFLRRDCEFTLRDVSERAGLDLASVRRNAAALRVPLVDPDEPAFSAVEVEGFRASRESVEAGLSYEAVLEMASVFGQAFAQLADGLVEVLLRELGSRSPHPDELALQLVAVAERLLPAATPSLVATHRMHLRTRVAREVIEQAELGAQALPGARDMVVAFADLEGFSGLSERAPLDEVTGVATRFAELAAGVVRPPATLVKMVGDAAMLVAPEPDPLVDSVLELCRQAGREALPPIHTGMASGAAVSRLGDWYGRPVNLASRVTGAAAAGDLLATAPVREASQRAGWEPVGSRALKGFDAEVELFRLPAGG